MITAKQLNDVLKEINSAFSSLEAKLDSIVLDVEELKKPKPATPVRKTKAATTNDS